MVVIYRVLHIMCFLVNHIYYHSVNLIYYHFPQLTILYQLFYCIIHHIQYNYIDITILLSYCNYIVTIIINIIYSYIYQYNISIKIYNSYYRYKHTDSIIGIIPIICNMNIHTVYTDHNYTIINTILVYSNFFSAYHSYLLLKQ